MSSGEVSMASESTGGVMSASGFRVARVCVPLGGFAVGMIGFSGSYVDGLMVDACAGLLKKKKKRERRNKGR